MAKVFRIAVCGALLTAMAFAGCKNREDEGSGLDIVNGVIDTGHPAVGQILLNGEGGCTGTLITQKTILTAGHCTISKDPNPKFSFRIGDKVHEIESSTLKHHAFNGENDIGLMWLKKPITNITPMALATKKPTVGQQIIIVGFGRNEKGVWDNQKRKAETVITSVGNSTFNFKGKKNTDKGDSGGPSFYWENGKEVILGIHSAQLDEVKQTNGMDMSVPYFLGWINSNKDGIGTAAKVLTVGKIDLSPISGSTLKGVVKVSLKASSPSGITGNQIPLMYECGNKMGPLFLKQQGQSDLFTMEWNTKQVPNGSCKIKGTVYDGAGAFKEVVTRTVTVKN